MYVARSCVSFWTEYKPSLKPTLLKNNLDFDQGEAHAIRLQTSESSWKKARERNQRVYFCFVDFTKPFDVVQHDQLWLTMLEMGFPPHLVELLRYLYSKQWAAVKIANH